MPLFKILSLGITGPTGEAEVGSVIELPAKSGQALVDEGHAEAVEGTPEGGQGDKTLLTGEEAAAAAAAAATAENDKLAEALNAKYNREEGGNKPGLAAAAKEAGVEFAYDASKADLIQAVIASGKAAALL